MSLRKTESVAAALSEVFYFKKVLRLLKKVAQSCPTPCDPIDCSLPGSSVHGIFQARVLEWVPISFSRGSSNPGIQPMSLQGPFRYMGTLSTALGTLHFGSAVRNPPAKEGDSRLDPWVRKILWRRKWEPTLVFLPAESHR